MIVTTQMSESTLQVSAQAYNLHNSSRVLKSFAMIWHDNNSKEGMIEYGTTIRNRCRRENGKREQ